MSILFSVHNQLGNNYKEKQYQLANEQLLNENHLAYKKELQAKLSFREKEIGRFYIDFVIEEKIVLELKAKPYLEPDDIRQVYSYLKTTGLQLAIIANFRTSRLTYRRIINPTKSISVNL